MYFPSNGARKACDVHFGVASVGTRLYVSAAQALTELFIFKEDSKGDRAYLNPQTFLHKFNTS